MKNWKSTIGGALSALGIFLFGAPVVMNATSPDFPKPVMVWCMVIGFVLQGLATFFAHLFSADAKALKDVADQVQENSKAIVTGDPSVVQAQLSKQAPPPPSPKP